jgi:hypothetical protein
MVCILFTIPNFIALLKVFINSELAGCFAGKSEPFIYAEIQSIGGFSAPNEVAKAVTSLLSKELGVEGNRIYLKMVNPDAKNFAYNGQTFG